MLHTVRKRDALIPSDGGSITFFEERMFGDLYFEKLRSYFKTYPETTDAANVVIPSLFRQTIVRHLNCSLEVAQGEYLSRLVKKSLSNTDEENRNQEEPFKHPAKCLKVVAGSSKRMKNGVPDSNPDMWSFNSDDLDAEDLTVKTDSFLDVQHEKYSKIITELNFENMLNLACHLIMTAKDTLSLDLKFEEFGIKLGRKRKKRN